MGGGDDGSSSGRAVTGATGAADSVSGRSTHEAVRLIRDLHRHGRFADFSAEQSGVDELRGLFGQGTAVTRGIVPAEGERTEAASAPAQGSPPGS